MQIRDIRDPFHVRSMQATQEKRRAEDISAVLYPNDATEYGRELRLKQQIFFVSAGLQVLPCHVSHSVARKLRSMGGLFSRSL